MIENIFTQFFYCLLFLRVSEMTEVFQGDFIGSRTFKAIIISELMLLTYFERSDRDDLTLIFNCIHSVREPVELCEILWDYFNFTFFIGIFIFFLWFCLFVFTTFFSLNIDKDFIWISFEWQMTKPLNFFLIELIQSW